MSAFTLEDLRRIMRECAGEDEAVTFGPDFAEQEFASLGYDSLALMETSSRVEREFGIALPEEELGDIESPRAFVDLVNSLLAQPV